jgi:hypothetical protein
MQLNEFIGNKAEEISKDDVIAWLKTNVNSHRNAKQLPITVRYKTSHDYLKLHEVSLKSNATNLERFLIELPSWKNIVTKNTGIFGHVGKIEGDGKLFVLIPSDKTTFVLHDSSYLEGSCKMLGITELSNESIEKWISHIIDHYVETIPDLEIAYDSANSYSGFKHRFITAIELLKKYDSRFKSYLNKSIQTTLNEIFAPDFHGNKIRRFVYLPATIENGQNVYMNGSVIAISVDAYKSLHEQGYIK